MGLDFDVIEFCRKLRLERAPPYQCPLEKCDRSYKSLCGMQYHLVNYDHDNPTPMTPATTPARKKGRSRPPVSTADLARTPIKEAPLSYTETHGVVHFEVDGKVAKLAITEKIMPLTEEELKKLSTTAGSMAEPPIEPHVKLPEPCFKLLPNYDICDAPPRPNAYIRFIEKSTEELDGEVEYDVDEEDTAWLGLMNEKREAQGLSPVSVDSLELLMDRLEKESFFQAAATGHSGGVVDDDAVCCICMDGECQNTNVILFCDMCNLAVHQDCYGVPYIPEGQWLCRRCLQSPSRPVDCVLCPNTGGAFKQTDRGHWAHVVCALWIPEVRFANTVFLEPIDSIESIPAARWKLSCYVCKQRGVGACIQCHRNNCYAAFHVTCAQHAGLFMRMDTVNREGTDGQPIMVQKTAFCDAHTPHTAAEQGDRGNKALESRNKMKQARRLLAKKRSSVPVILIPTIPPERVQEIASLVSIPKKPQFIQRLIAYWTLKRHYRNGVPLLRRLQSQGSGGGRSLGDGAPDTAELCRQLKYWQCLRQDLERARLLCELVRKREKLKAALIRVKESCIMFEINPLEASMNKLLEQLHTKDTAQIFSEPVDLEEVPDYSTVVTEPMDLSEMKLKLDSGKYATLRDMEADFNLMIANCLAYNNRDTVFYRHGVRMRDQGTSLFKYARRELESSGLITIPSTEPAKEVIPKKIDAELQNILEQPVETRYDKLEKLLEKASTLKHGLAKAKRIRTIRAEIRNLKHAADSSQSDGEPETAPAMTNVKTSPPKINSNSPTGGVNRRTAVLFTRKAQAAAAISRKSAVETVPKLEVVAGENANKQSTSPAKKALPEDPDPQPAKSGRRGRRSKGGKKKTSSKDSTKELISPGEKDPTKTTPSMKESFLVYRGRQEAPGSDSESEGSYSGSSCSSCSMASDESCDMDCSRSSEFASTETETDHDTNKPKPSLGPLQLVWAKCRGYPWYPALIIDPNTPRGFVHNGVPLPAPPSDVLTLRKDKTDKNLFLVLFFDAKRTWQWLPADKLELLGLDKPVDQIKLVESRKPADRKAVKKAYQDALLYKSQVTDAQGPGAIM